MKTKFRIFSIWLFVFASALEANSEVAKVGRSEVKTSNCPTSGSYVAPLQDVSCPLSKVYFGDFVVPTLSFEMKDFKELNDKFILWLAVQKDSCPKHEVQNKRKLGSYYKNPTNRFPSSFWQENFGMLQTKKNSGLPKLQSRNIEISSDDLCEYSQSAPITQMIHFSLLAAEKMEAIDADRERKGTEFVKCAYCARMNFMAIFNSLYSNKPESEKACSMLAFASSQYEKCVKGDSTAPQEYNLNSGSKSLDSTDSGKMPAELQEHGWINILGTDLRDQICANENGLDAIPSGALLVYSRDDERCDKRKRQPYGHSEIVGNFPDESSDFPRKGFRKMANARFSENRSLTCDDKKTIHTGNQMGGPYCAILTAVMIKPTANILCKIRKGFETGLKQGAQ